MWGFAPPPIVFPLRPVLFVGIVEVSAVGLTHIPKKKLTGSVNIVLQAHTCKKG